jgi:hypothetical protein
MTIAARCKAEVTTTKKYDQQQQSPSIQNLRLYGAAALESRSHGRRNSTARAPSPDACKGSYRVGVRAGIHRKGGPRQDQLTQKGRSYAEEAIAWGRDKDPHCSCSG